MSVPDRIVVHPSRIAGQIALPGDKSLSHRALLIGALVGAPVPLSGVAPSGDVLAMANAVRLMGASLELDVDPSDGNLNGAVCGPLNEPSDVVDCGNAGTAIRLLAGVAAGIEGMSVLTGDHSLRSRPMARIVEPLRALGATVDAAANGSRAPIVIRGGVVRSAEYVSPVASAQVKSAVLLAGQRAGTAVSVASPLASRDHTERMLNHLGGDVTTHDDEQGREVVSLQPRGLASAPVAVSGDPSSAAFWLVASVLHGSRIAMPGVLANVRRDGAERALRAMGARIDRRNERSQSGEPVADLSIDGAGLAGGLCLEGIDVVDAIDELMVLALAGAVSDGGLQVRDAGEMRVKESDRLDALGRIAIALGVHVDVTPDGFVIPGGQSIVGGGVVDAAGDHRVAMTAAIGASAGTQPVEITGCASIPTSYPTFLRDFEAAGGTYEVLETAELP